MDPLRDAIGHREIKHQTNVAALCARNGDIASSIEMQTYRDLIFASDCTDENSDLYQVMGIAASTRTLAQATVRRRVKAALDLGTGCGVLALLAAAHSDQVVAVDSNPRALSMARFNAENNNISGIEFLEGNLFEPVRGRQFDLIVCNPPFIVSPEQIYMHSHNDLPLDRFCETIVRSAPAFMTEGGYCQLLCNWVQFSGDDWRGRLASWFEGSGCDVWVLHSHSEDAADYALNRISKLTQDPEQSEKKFDAWTEYYRLENVEAIGFGLINMRRSTKKANWFCCDDWPEMIGECGDAIERGFNARDFLQSHSDDDALLNARVRRAPNLEWDDIPKAGASRESSVRFTSGLAYAATMDSSIVRFVSRCAGDGPLLVQLQEAAATASVTPAQFAPRFLKTVRRLIERGILLPAEY